MRFGCLINPLSGGKRGVELLRRLSELKDSGALDLEILILNPPDFRNQWQVLSGFERVIIAGGDGTISQLLPVALNSRVGFGILPLGTANDLARELGVLRRMRGVPPQKAFEFFAAAGMRQLTVWKISSVAASMKSALFCNYVSFGFDAEVAARFDAWRKDPENIFGRTGVWGNRCAYLWAGILALKSPGLGGLTLRSGPHRNVERFPAALRTALFANIRSYMGLGFSNPVSDPFDGRIEGVGLSSVFSYPVMLLRGVFPGLGACRVESAGSWEIDGIPEGTVMQLDGEPRTDMPGPGFRIEPAGFINVLV